MSLLSRLAVTAARAYGILSSNPNNVPASYLVVAGGGSGGAFISGTATGGGGGAGGYQASTFTLSTLNTYSITVGAGGVGTLTTGANGSNSVISGTGLTTITSTGGGGGGCNSNGQAGGSGGGGGGNALGTTGGTATSGQGNTGGAGIVGFYPGGGGGGAGAVGGIVVSTTGGSGGNGSASSISGSSVTYAGGGGGAGSTAGGGGSGGGGAGNATGVGTAGTANLGGGGGGSSGASGTNLGGNGGSGIVIISYTSATPKFVGGTITTSGGNQIHTFTSTGSLTPLSIVTASYLVVAGGGGGGYQYGGGGGAGGLLTSSTTLYYPATYIVTVGAGGAGATSTAANGINGSNSVLSGTGLTTVTSTGGGGGAKRSTVGNAGGSGGGGAGDNSSVGGAGTSGQGFGGGTGSNAAGDAGGGGGGASAVGANAVTTAGGNGGAGSSSSISGSSVTYAGGGGGPGGVSNGSGGSGGGGAGNNGAAGIAGTTNTGGGGGGSYNIYAGGAGGSGVVIISYAGSQKYSGGLVTSSGGNTIHTFNATGALTPLTNNLNNSLRFRSSASAYLSRTFGTPTNNKIFTWSAWIKLGTIPSSREGFLIGSNGTGSYFGLEFNASAGLSLWDNNTSTSAAILVTTQVFRDPSAWYHIVLAVDTTQATAANRIKLYVNGSQVTALSTATYPAQNSNPYMNSSSSIHNICNWTGTSLYLDGYLAEINFIDGQQLEPYYFGNNDAYGNWKPITYRGMYGTNGFYLNFADTSALTTSSNAGLGKDTSGNGNYWATNNISITAGTTYDAMTDVPTNTSATVANYATWNGVALGLDATLSAGNLNIAYGASGTRTGTPATIGISSGKYYWEHTTTAQSGSFEQTIGIVNSTANSSVSSGIGYYVGYTANGWGYESSAGNKYTNATSAAYGASWTSSDIMGVAFDADNGTLTFYKNNVSQGTAFTGLTSGPYFPAIGDGSSLGTFTSAVNFGQRPFTYTPPTGFVALNTYNLPTPTILQGNLYMSATSWTGNSTTNVIVNQSQMKPDAIWIKTASAGAFNHHMVDSVRGVTKVLLPNTSGVEVTSTDQVTAINSNGFTLGADTAGPADREVNVSGSSYIGWQWQAGQGSTSSNTSGSITSTVSVNTTAGFSVVTYTGNGSSGATVGHGIGAAPKMIIVKCRNTASTDWPVYHTSVGPSQSIYLDLTNAAASTTTLWNAVNPSSSVFTLGSSSYVNGSTQTYVAYCWAAISGFSAFGSYTGNGSTSGPFVYLGFRTKFIMFKRTDTAGYDWWIYDTTRDAYNSTYIILRSPTNTGNAGTAGIDITANGFRQTQTDPSVNANGGTYIYMAFAENPFKNANAR